MGGREGRCALMAHAPPPHSIYMSSGDFIVKESLDFGSFGQLELCYHKSLGQVVRRTVYCAPLQRRNEHKLLLQEALLLYNLNHRCIVKLLGVILEEGIYSLVKELIPNDNLLTILKRVQVPVSVKCRIILEILEGMTYLSESNVTHCDLKPENILVDEDFHIKIADLGLANCKTWSRLVQEASSRQSRLAARQNTGTEYAGAEGSLGYMAPELLESFNTQPSEKTDVYSFAIVVWVILTGREPYENCESERLMCRQVRNGTRPEELLIPPDTHSQIVDLMRGCWNVRPHLRPKFTDSYRSFQSFYRNELEKRLEWDVLELKDLEDSTENMTSASQEMLPFQRKLGVESKVGAMDSNIELDAFPTSVSLQKEPQQEHSSTGYSNLISQSAAQKRGVAAKSMHCSQEAPPMSSPIVATVARHTAGQNHTNVGFQRAQSCPSHCGSGLEPSGSTEMNQAPSDNRIYRDSPCLIIQNARWIQIGNYNQINTGSMDEISVNSCEPNPNQPSSLITDLLQQCGDQTVDKEHLKLVWEMVGKEWKCCARKLGLSNRDIEAIEHDHYGRGGLREMVYQMLETWRMKEGLKGSTVGRLCQALRDLVDERMLVKLLLLRSRCEGSES